LPWALFDDAFRRQKLDRHIEGHLPVGVVVRRNVFAVGFAARLKTTDFSLSAVI